MTSRYFMWIVLSVSLICFPALSKARQAEQLHLHFFDMNVQGSRSEPTSINLEKEINIRYPDLHISSLDLRKIIVVAKSSKGRGAIQLRTGKEITGKYSISGNPNTFRDPSEYTFDQININNNSNHSNGPWELHFSGNIILRKIILFVEEDIYSSTTPYLKGNDRSNHYGKWQRDSLQQPPLPLILPGRSWGTELEGEQLCGQRSRNVRDGWDFPDSICQAGSRASYHQDYRPVQLFLRPDIRPLELIQLYHNIRDLKVSATLSAQPQDHTTNSVFAILGIEIAGHTYTKNISINSRANWRKRSSIESLEISGNWTRRDLNNARVYILPQKNCGDFTVQQLQISVTGVR